MTATLHIPSLTFRVRNLDQSADFYGRKLGFVVVQQSAEKLELATEAGAAPLLTLLPGANRPAPRDATGLFHAALLLPSREVLGSWLSFAAAHGIEFEGFSDHGVSEAIYLSDPDGNGLEIYADRPRSEWPFANGELAMTTRPLAIRALLATAKANAMPLMGGRWGHLHLRVADLDQSDAFYQSTLNLTVTQRSYPEARFLAADNYHHHLGLNTWGHPHFPLPADASGLVEAVFARTAVTSEVQHTDPDGLVLRLVPLRRQPTPAEPVNAS